MAQAKINVDLIVTLFRGFVGCFYFVKDKKDLEYYSKACELNYGDGCAILGDIYHHGEGVTQNFKKAFQYYSKACELNEALTCTLVGEFYRDGVGVAKDLKKLLNILPKLVN